jgi:hypothetical protein
VRNKYTKHLGFVLEAAIESFPQSILQMTALLIYSNSDGDGDDHTPNYSWISILSIILSMTSVSLKSLVLSQGIDVRLTFWTWISIITDFFALFMMICFLFYAGFETYTSVFFGVKLNLFAQIYFWKMCLTSVPIFVGSFIGTYIMWVGVAIYEGVSFDCEACLFIFFLCPLWIFCASSAAFIASEIVAFSIPSLFVYVLLTNKWKPWSNISTNNQQLFEDLITFLKNSRKEKANNDSMVRLLAINKQIGSGSLQFFIQRQQSIGIDALRSTTFKLSVCTFVCFYSPRFLFLFLFRTKTNK